MSAEPLPGQTTPPKEQVELTISISKDTLAALQVAAFQRRSLGEPEFGLQQLICEALAKWMESEADDTTVVVIEV